MRTRTLIVAALAVGGFACSGCFQISSVLIVKGDGSGAIEQRLLLTSAALAQIRGLGAIGGGNGPNFDPFSEQQARAAAASLGPGVTYVSSTPVKTPHGEGRDIRYSFTDISQLHITEQPPALGGISIATLGGPAEQISFKLTQEPGGNALLRIIVPRPSLAGSDRGQRNPGGQISLDQIAMFRQMLAGAHLSIFVEPVGQIVRTSSPYADGTRVTLIDLDLDQLLNDQTVLSRLQAALTPEEVKAILKDIPGVTVNLDPEITIEFAPQR